MADKEERIYISHYTKDVCSDCLHDHCYEGLCNCDFEYKNGITRQEAIEVMAKALCHRHCPEKVCTCCDEWEKYGTKEDAEVALNALLGVEK